MKKILIIGTALWCAIFLAPVVVIGNKPLADKYLPVQKTAQGRDSEIEITVWDENQVKKLKLDEYLQGVVASEMPALFPEEALKAQAVAARTYTLNRASLTPSTEHHGAMVCSNPTHCKAYKPLDSFTASWGISRDTYTEKIKNAVSQTDGEILLYDNKPISAVFHSTSSGRTERAADVWGSDVPYLQSVESPGEESAPSYMVTVDIPVDKFKSEFLKKFPSADLSSPPGEWFKNSTRSQAGGVMTVYVGGVKVKGSDIRTLCGLRSTNFTLKADENTIKFTTRGYGHGVGMSQYGARAMANQGKGYREILSWYYSGTELGKVENKK